MNRLQRKHVFRHQIYSPYDGDAAGKIQITFRRERNYCRLERFYVERPHCAACSQLRPSDSGFTTILSNMCTHLHLMYILATTKLNIRAERRKMLTINPETFLNSKFSNYPSIKVTESDSRIW